MGASTQWCVQRNQMLGISQSTQHSCFHHSGRERLHLSHTSVRLRKRRDLLDADG